MKLLYTTLLFTFFTSAAFTQKITDTYSNILRSPSGHIKCLTMEADDYNRALYPERGRLEEFERWLAPRIEEYKRMREENPNRFPPVLTIPVVVHVIHNGDALGAGENINDAQVFSQIRVMNEDFRRILGTPGYNTNAVGADVEVEFCIAQTDPFGQPTNGINRVLRPEASWTSMASIDGTLKPATIWPPNEYLNMWSIRFSGGMAGTLGYAQFPDASGLGGMPASGGAATSDGVVASFDAFGSQAYAAGTYNPTYNLGRTMTHEVGHWLGLRHIWGDGPCSVDDFCNDTPISDAANFGCLNTNSCIDPAPDPRDQVENYMDYSDDACMNIFTGDQKTRVRTVMTISPRRMSLTLSNKCQPPRPTIGFTTDLTTVTEGTDCNFQDIVLTLNISMAPSAAATVTFNSSGTATGGGMDYSFTPASVVFLAGSTANRTVTVRIYNDGQVEGIENLTIAFTVTTVGDAVAATGDLRDHTITINNDDFAPSPTTNTTILLADFNTGFNGFTTTGNAGSDRFVLGTAATASSPFWTVQNTNTSQFAYTNDDRCNCNKNADRLISPVFSLAGYTNASLSFDHAFAGAAGETGLVQISTNGGTSYTTLQTLTNTSTNLGGGAISSPWVNNNIISLNAYLGQTNLLIRFQYADGNGWFYGLAVDNIKVFTTVPTQVQPIVNILNKDFHQVRSNETTHWFDPATSRVMGTIVNTSTWNYNCTSMEVNRDQVTAGATTVPFWNAIPADRLMAKTFYVSPANNTPTGTYNVTFYFTAAEITAWETATGKSRNNLKIIKVANNPISVVNSGNFSTYNIQIVPATLGTFGTNFTLTASFSSGFSGFGFGDPALIILPVELLSFKGVREGRKVRLLWETATENNSDYFSLEHSPNGLDFTEIANVKAAEKSRESRQYRHLDQNPFKGYNYYRLVQADKDGTKTNSQVISVDMSEEVGPPMSIYPNPASSVLNINFDTPYNSEMSIDIIDAVGKSVVKQQGLPVEFGNNNFQLNINDLAQGIYIIKITQGPSVHTQIFLKK
jgi:hypothetical protein